MVGYREGLGVHRFSLSSVIQPASFSGHLVSPGVGPLASPTGSLNCYKPYGPGALVPSPSLQMKRWRFAQLQSSGRSRAQTQTGAQVQATSAVAFQHVAMEVGQHGAHVGGDVRPACWAGCRKVTREEVQERPGQARDAIHASSLEGSVSVLWEVGSLWMSVSDSPCDPLRVSAGSREAVDRAGWASGPPHFSRQLSFTCCSPWRKETVLLKSAAQDLGCTPSGLRISAAALWLRERRR